MGYPSGLTIWQGNKISEMGKYPQITQSFRKLRTIKAKKHFVANKSFIEMRLCLVKKQMASCLYADQATKLTEVRFK